MQAFKPSDEVDFSRRYTLEEFWALPEREDRVRYDLIGGYIFLVPPANPPHGSLDSRFNVALVKFILENNIDGEVHHPREPIYRRAEASTYLEPDMMFVSRELRERMGSNRASADIVFEYLSRSTAKYDRTTKADAYLALGVRELWLVDPVTVTIEVRHASSTNDGSAVWETHKYSTGEYARSRGLAGFEVSVDEIFSGLT